MTPPDDSTSKYVVCASCGSKAASSWSFCRACNSSLDDADPFDEDVRTENTPDLGPTGCPKCGHEDARVDQVATTGTGLTRLMDLQSRQFSAVSCTNCGYTELYRNGDADVIVDLFLG